MWGFDLSESMLMAFDVATTFTIFFGFIVGLCFFNQEKSFALTVSVLGLFQAVDLILVRVLLYSHQYFGAIVGSVWHVSFITLNSILIWSITKLHIQNGVRLASAAKLVIVNYVLMSSVHMARFIDRSVFETNGLVNFYEKAIPTFSTIIASYIFYQAVQIIWINRPQTSSSATKVKAQ